MRATQARDRLVGELQQRSVFPRARRFGGPPLMSKTCPGSAGRHTRAPDPASGDPRNGLRAVRPRQGRSASACSRSWTSTSTPPSRCGRSRCARPTARTSHPPVMEDAQGRGEAAAACGTCSCPTRSTAPAWRTATTRRWPRSWGARRSRQRRATATRRTPATWRSCTSSGRPSSRSAGCGRCSTARSARPSQ